MNNAESVNRLTDEQVAWYAGTSRSARWTADMAVHENIITLAREVQERRRLDALRPVCPTCEEGCNITMCLECGEDYSDPCGYHTAAGHHASSDPYGDSVECTSCCPDCTDGKMPLDQWIELLTFTLQAACDTIDPLPVALRQVLDMVPKKNAS